MSEFAELAYKNVYCLVSEKYKECKRYMAAEVAKHPVPEYIMPNSKKSVDEIVSIINSK